MRRHRWFRTHNIILPTHRLRTHREQVLNCKYNNKGLDGRNGLNMYNNLARLYAPVIPHTPTPDPHAENYYNWSPYAWVGNNNPLRITDPTGMDWHQDSDGTYQ